MVVAVDAGFPARLDDLVGAEQARERAWLAEQRLERGIAELKAGPRRAATARLFAERDARRQRQEVLASRSALVSAHLARLMDVAGWAARSYPPVPDGQDRMPGRRWGTSRYAHHRGGQGRLTILLPEQLGEQVRRVSHWVSRRATAELQQLADETSSFFPLDLLKDMGELAVELYALPLDELPAAVRRRTRARPGPIVSTGDLVRAAAYRAATFDPAAAEESAPAPA